MPRKKQEPKTPLEAIMEQLDQKVERRAQAVLNEAGLSRDIAQLVSEARRHGATMPEIVPHVRVMNPKTREMRVVTRQAVDAMLAALDERRPPRTTRASRRSSSSAGGRINAEALR